MAEITPDSSLAEVISSLDLAVVPEKLHCSTCHGFLLNAYKTSCCEQNVCERCFNQITDHCPMCKHKPFSKELCRPAKAMRNTVKAYLKSVEKTLADERAKAQTEQVSFTEDGTQGREVAEAQAEANREVENGIIEIPTMKSEDAQLAAATPVDDVQPSIEDEPSDVQPNDIRTTLSNEDDSAKRQASVESDANDDEIEIQVEPSAEDSMLDIPQGYEMDEQEPQYGNTMSENTKNGDSNMHEMSNGMDSNGFNMQNMNMMGFNSMGMDMNMMQQMMNMNPMMAMGMNPMFGGFGGSNGNMNGMNMMGMNFNPSQMFNAWSGQNSNMWQNNNAMNAMGGDFGSQFGSNMSQQGNLYSQQYPNGDFNSGYNGRPGRGRFRGRGSYGRGRGSFNQYQPNFGHHSTHEQQHDNHSMPSQPTQSVNGQNGIDKTAANNKEEEAHDQDDFAPGGQDEVQEALGNDDRDADIGLSEPLPEVLPADANGSSMTPSETQPAITVEQPTVRERPSLEKIIPEAYHEDFESMAPPSAPTGPSGRYSDKEFAFRARGHGKYSSRGRNSFSASAGFPASPVRSVSQTSVVAASPPAKGVGVVGAPTGPRAMREPQAPKASPRPIGNSGGFQIMGRASMQPQVNQSKDEDRPKSASPVNGHDEYEDERSSSRRHSKHDKYNDNRTEADAEFSYEQDRSDRDRDRKVRRSRRDEPYDDYEMQDADQDYNSPDRKTSHRSSKYDKDRNRREEKYSSSSKHRSSRRHYDDEAQSDYDKDEYSESATDKHRSSRSTKSSSKYDNGRDRDRDRDRDAHRDKKRDRDRDRDRDREEERGRDKEERHRKRSRHDRDREDEYDDHDDDESKHRSRRHKKEHYTSSSRKDRDKDFDDSDLGLRISGRSNSNRQSALPTPTSATSSLPPTSIADAEKDPHTLEREARNRERMLKEQQRREKAALDKRGSAPAGKSSSRATTAGGRRVSYKYEDEVERGMGAADEREKARWR